MTEQTASTAAVESTSTVTGGSEQPAAPKNSSNTGTLLSSVAIALIIALAGGGYYYVHKQFQLQTKADHEQEVATQILQTQLAELKDNQQQEREHLQTLLKAQEQALSTAAQKQSELNQRIASLQDKITSITAADSKAWLLSQADFLVKMAGRKLWNEQDVNTASLLLKSADASLAEMNDPALLDVRRALTEDISGLAAMTHTDYDGILLHLNQLSNQVDSLRLADDARDDAPVEDTSPMLSSSLNEWRQNLTKSWNSFLSDFITIRRRSGDTEPLLAPNQDFYLRENIRARLLIAAQAVPRHQNQIYKESLETVSTWVRSYFDENDPSTKAFLSELDNLSQQSVALDIPPQLKGQPLLEKVMQSRLHNQVVTPAATAIPTIAQGE